MAITTPSIEPDQVAKNIPDFKKVSPTFGEVFAWSLLNCRGLQVQPAYEPLKIHAEGAAPIVVIGTTRDPATPYEEAVALAGELESGVLVARRRRPHGLQQGQRLHRRRGGGLPDRGHRPGGRPGVLTA